MRVCAVFAGASTCMCEIVRFSVYVTHAVVEDVLHSSKSSKTTVRLINIMRKSSEFKIPLKSNLRSINKKLYEMHQKYRSKMASVPDTTLGAVT